MSYVNAVDISALRVLRTLRGLRPLRAVSRWGSMQVSRKNSKSILLLLMQLNRARTTSVSGAEWERCYIDICEPCARYK